MKWFKRKKPAVVEMETVRIEPLPLTGIEKMELEQQTLAEMKRREAREKRDAELRQEIAKIRAMIDPHLQVIRGLELELYGPGYQQMNVWSQQLGAQGMGMMGLGMGGLLGNIIGNAGGRSA